MTTVSQQSHPPDGAVEVETTPDAICVRIPDLFSSVMATELRVNPHYFPTVREEGYERIKR